MKCILFIGILLGMVVSCQIEEAKLGDFAILPSPQKFEITGVSSISPQAITTYYSPTGLDLKGVTDISVSNKKNSILTIDVDSSMQMNPEGYTMEIGQNAIHIIGKDADGAFYGAQTLKQLIQDASDQNVFLPKVSISDYPLLAYRAIHIDVKHHRETLEFYFDLMDRLALYKINGIIAEVEDKIQYTRRPVIASADALSKEEWKEVSAYALDRNIEISPLVQGLGHASFILKHDKYKNLRDDPESDWAFNPLDPLTYELQFDLYLDALEALPHGDYLHIGGDEVHTTGKGSGKSALELQLIWLDKVCKFAAEQGRTPIFWDDMPLKHAEVYRPMFDRNIEPSEVDSIWKANESNLVEFIDLFPKNCIYMRWNYQTPETYGNLKAMDWFTSNGFQVMGATAGQTRWSLMPQNESNIENIKSFALSSIDKGLDGLLLTLWDDDSPHFELYLRGILAFAEHTWAGDKRSKDEFKLVFQQRAFGLETQDSTFNFIDKLEVPVAYWKNALLQNGKSRNNLRNIENPILSATLPLPNLENKGKWSEEHAERLKLAKEYTSLTDTIARKIETALSKADRNQYTLQVYKEVNDLVRFSLKALLALEAYDRSTEGGAEEARQQVMQLKDEFQKTRKQLESVYSEVRILNKPDGYILDEDHHRHNANQSQNFDWQFYPEMLLLEKIESNL